jgi:anti-sigma regulatory factor (Ser/Thr protein kinase)
VITLTLPCERRFFQTARLVVAGLATRLGLPYEQMDDLQLAVETVLGKHVDSGVIATIELAIEQDAVRIRVGPVGHSLADEDASDDGLDTRRLLNALVERVDVVESEGREWLRLEDGIRAG